MNPPKPLKNAELQALQAINNCSAQALVFLSPTTEPVDGDSFFPENHPMLIQCYPLVLQHVNMVIENPHLDYYPTKTSIYSGFSHIVP